MKTCAVKKSPRQNLYVRFYYTSFLDLAFAKTLTIKDPRNSIELIEYKSFFLQQSLEKLFKAILLKNDINYNPKTHSHSLTNLAKDISTKFDNTLAKLGSGLTY